MHDPLRRVAPPPRETGGPAEVDQAERAQLMRIVMYFAPACYLMLALLWYFLHVPGWLFGIMLLLDVPLTVAGVFAIHSATSGASAGFVRMLFAAGDIAPPRTYPRQDVLIARGEYREAASYFEDHLRVEPADNEARMRLADLLERKLDDHTGAERAYLDARRANPTPQDERRIGNGLIDLYRKMGRADRLRVELARFADRNAGTTAGEAAARELKELKTGA
jgi:tetratricopeptide (TPR) repeat protein